MKNCCTDGYKQLLNKPEHFSMPRAAELQNITHQMGRGWHHTVLRAQSTHLGYTYFRTWWLFANSTVAEHGKSISPTKYFSISSLSSALIALVSSDSGGKKTKNQTKAQTTLAQEPTAASCRWAFTRHETYKNCHCCRSRCIYLAVEFPNLVKYYTACRVHYGYHETKSMGQKHLSRALPWIHLWFESNFQFFQRSTLTCNLF